MPTLNPGRTALYRLRDVDGALLYVGISQNLDIRWTNHAYTQPWWHMVHAKEITWFETRAEAAEAERQAVRSENPRFDATHRCGRWRTTQPVYTEDPLQSRAASEFRAAIERGDFPRGRRLPPRTHLAERFGTSVACISRIISGLTEEKLLGYAHGVILYGDDVPPPRSRPRKPAYGVGPPIYEDGPI